MKKILVVDDEKDFREMLAEIVRSQEIPGTSLDVQEASNGEAALQLMGEESFDLVFLDLTMPRTNGLAVISRLRDASGPNQSVPIIVISGYLRSVDCGVGEDAFEDVYFVRKPLDEDRIARLLLMQFAGKRAS